MDSTKYGKYIITEYLDEEELLSRGRHMPVITPGTPSRFPLLWLDEKLIPGAFYMEALMYTPGSQSAAPVAKSQTHPFDEVLVFIGTDLENPTELGGEIELMLGDEKHIINKTCLVFIPRGLKHLPLTVKRVDRPIVHLNILNGGEYLWSDTK